MLATSPVMVADNSGTIELIQMRIRRAWAAECEDAGRDR
jgi:hypothetical protein